MNDHHVLVTEQGVRYYQVRIILEHMIKCTYLLCALLNCPIIDNTLKIMNNMSSPPDLILVKHRFKYINRL